MKKIYIKPETTVVFVQLQQMIAFSGVGSTSEFSESISEETTDQAMSRQRSVWDDDEWDDED